MSEHSAGPPPTSWSAEATSPAAGPGPRRVRSSRTALSLIWRAESPSSSNQRLRTLADSWTTLRKRCASQVSGARAETLAEVAARFLPVVDNLERALAHAEADPASIVDGIGAVLEQATGILGQLGFPRRDDLGATF